MSKAKYCDSLEGHEASVRDAVHLWKSQSENGRFGA